MRRPASRECLPTETTIHSVVHGFYAKVRRDDLLASVFEPRMAGHWREHLDTMVDFWSSVLLTTGRYRGRPLAVHGELGEITPEMWSRWLKLFAETSHEHACEPVAALFIQRAEQIAAHLSRSLAMRRPKPIQEISMSVFENVLPSLQTDTPAEGRELAILIARKTIAAIQPDAARRESLRPSYAEDAAGLMQAAQIAALEFQTIAAANNYWRE